MCAPITPAEAAKRRELYDRGLSDAVIGEAQGVTANAVRRWRIRNDLPSNCNRPVRRSGNLSAAEHAARMLLYQMRYSDRRIRRAPPRWPKLTENQKAAVREAFAANPKLSVRELADRFATSIGRISEAIRGFRE